MVRERLLRGFVVNSMVLGLDFCWSAVVELGMDPPVIEPIDPAQGGEFEIVGAWRGSFPIDQFGLEPEPGLAVRASLSSLDREVTASVHSLVCSLGGCLWRCGSDFCEEVIEGPSGASDDDGGCGFVECGDCALNDSFHLTVGDG